MEYNSHKMFSFEIGFKEEYYLYLFIIGENWKKKQPQQQIIII